MNILSGRYSRQGKKATAKEALGFQWRMRSSPACMAEGSVLPLPVRKYLHVASGRSELSEALGTRIGHCNGCTSQSIRSLVGMYQLPLAIAASPSSSHRNALYYSLAFVHAARRTIASSIPPPQSREKKERVTSMAILSEDRAVSPRGTFAPFSPERGGEAIDGKR